MDKENIKAYVYQDTGEGFSMKKLRAGMGASAAYFLLACVFGIYYRACISTGILAVVFASYECWFYIWIRGYFKDSFVQGLFLKGSMACFFSLFFALSAFVFCGYLRKSLVYMDVHPGIYSVDCPILFYNHTSYKEKNLHGERGKA